MKIVEKGKKDIEIIPADPTVRNYTHTVVNGKLFFREKEILVAVQGTGKTLDRMMGMHQIRQKAKAMHNFTNTVYINSLCGIALTFLNTAAPDAQCLRETV